MQAITIFGTFDGLKTHSLFVEGQENGAFLKDLESLVVLDNRSVSFVPETPPVIMLSRKQTVGGIITWIGRYRYFAQPDTGRHGGYLGVGISLVGTTVDGTSVLDLLIRLTDEFSFYIRKSPNYDVGLGKVTFADLCIDQQELLRVSALEERLDADCGVSDRENGRTCYYDLSQKEQAETLGVAISNAQTSRAFRDFNRVVLFDNFIFLKQIGRDAGVKILTPADVKRYELEPVSAGSQFLRSIGAPSGRPISDQRQSPTQSVARESTAHAAPVRLGAWETAYQTLMETVSSLNTRFSRRFDNVDRKFERFSDEMTLLTRKISAAPTPSNGHIPPPYTHLNIIVLFFAISILLCSMLQIWQIRRLEIDISRVAAQSTLPRPPARPFSGYDSSSETTEQEAGASNSSLHDNEVEPPGPEVQKPNLPTGWIAPPQHLASSANSETFDDGLLQKLGAISNLARGAISGLQSPQKDVQRLESLRKALVAIDALARANPVYGNKR